MHPVPTKRAPILGIALAISAWLAFIWINSTINLAPFARSELTVIQAIFFLAPLFISLAVTLWVVIHNLRRSLLMSLLLVGLLGFRLFDLTNPVTVLGLFAVVGGLEWYGGRPKVSRKPLHHAPVVQQDSITKPFEVSRKP